MEMKQILSDVKFALDNGFINIERKMVRGGEVMFRGSFGYIVVSERDAEEINNLLNQYAPIKINDVTTLERYQEHSGVRVGDTVSTGKRTKLVREIRLVKCADRNGGKPELWFTMDSSNGSYDIVSATTVKKYKVLHQSS